MEGVVLVYGKRKGEKWVRAIHREYGYFAVTNTMRIVSHATTFLGIGDLH
jgi:hypothetical protein